MHPAAELRGYKVWKWKSQILPSLFSVIALCGELRNLRQCLKPPFIKTPSPTTVLFFLVFSISVFQVCLPDFSIELNFVFSSRISLVVVSVDVCTPISSAPFQAIWHPFFHQIVLTFLYTHPSLLVEFTHSTPTKDSFIMSDKSETRPDANIALRITP